MFVFVRLQTLIIFFLCFSAFYELQCHLYKNIYLNIYYGNILLHFGLVGVKIHKINIIYIFSYIHIFIKHIFLTIPNKFVIQNNPLVQLRLIVHKIINKNKLKVWKFQSQRLIKFSAIKKAGTGVEGGRR